MTTAITCKSGGSYLIPDMKYERGEIYYLAAVRYVVPFVSGMPTSIISRTPSRKP